MFDLLISYKQYHCCLSNYLPHKGFCLFVCLFWGVDHAVDNFSGKYVAGLLGAGVQHSVQGCGVFHGGEFIGGEIRVYCEVRCELHVPSGLFK